MPPSAHPASAPPRRAPAPRRGGALAGVRRPALLRPAPAGPRVGPAARTGRGGTALPWRGSGVADRLRALPDGRLVDRLLTGRAWIPVLGVLLIGIVTMQVSLLGLNAGIGRAVERGAELERRNAALRAANGRLSAGERVREAALDAGLVEPTAGSVRFLRARADAPLRAARTMRAPAPTAPTGSSAWSAAPASSASTTAAGTSTATPTTTGSSTSAAVASASGTAAIATSATPSATSTTTPTTTAPPTTSTAPTTATAPVAPTAAAPVTSSPASATAGGYAVPAQP